MVEKNQKNLIPRPPVVVVLGHVDHGKSSILEKIKDLKITAKESGGITQHIGAYEVTVGHPEGAKATEGSPGKPDGILRSAQDDSASRTRTITFIDTPGHAAFIAMRSRGAKVADIAILVVAGEEGVKPQTKEAIEHIKGAKLPLIVAINKMDKPGANAEKVKRQLAEKGVQVESMGGQVSCVETSAKTGKGISDLLEIVLLVAEMEELKANLNEKAEGVIIEAYLDSKRGPTATLILQNGVLKKNDILGTVSTWGKIKIMEDFQGQSVDKPLPSMPVVVIGFEKVPGVGEEFKTFADIEQAKKELRGRVGLPAGKAGIVPQARTSPEDKRVLNLVLKVDVLGSLEAIRQALKDIPEEKVILRILKAEVGEINDSDVKIAEGARAVIIGFRVKTNQIAQKLVLRNNVRIFSFEVIYELVQAVRELLEKRVEPEITRIDLGKVEISAIFRTEKNRQIIGGKVREGKIQRAALLDVYRDEEKIGQGKVVNLKRDQNEIGQVEKGKDCGILYQGDVQVEEGDILEAYVRERKKGEL